MIKTLLAGTLILGQALALFILGFVLFWWSNDLMLGLIHLVGEEKALGENNVIRTEKGEVLLTNPVGMLYWMLPFLIPAMLQISAGMTLVWLYLKQVLPCSKQKTA